MGEQRCKPIALGAVDIEGIKAPAGALVMIENLIGTKLTYTAASGATAQVDVVLNILA